MSEVKERISVSKFVEDYNNFSNDQLRDKYIKSHIKTIYAPILQKKLILEMMNEKSVVETPVKHIDMTVSKLNFVMAILVLYTDLEPNKQENEDGTTTPLTWDTYDLLKSSGLYGKILDAIGEDLNELVLINEQIIDSWQVANVSTEAYINNLVETASRRFGISIELLLDKVTEIIEDEKKMNKVISAFEKVIKKIK